MALNFLIDASNCFTMNCINFEAELDLNNTTATAGLFFTYNLDLSHSWFTVITILLMQYGTFY